MLSLPFIARLLSTLPLIQTAYAKLLTSPNELTKLQYDFIIVGAGTAGNVLASRLTEDSQISVLVVEAGISDANNLDISVPFLGVAAPGTSVDWNYTTSPQTGLNNRSIPFTRGYVLGGSSSINLLAWTRGSDDVWNNWGNLTHDDGWSWKSVEPYYLKTSRLVPPADGHDTTGQVNSSAHGFGPVEVSVPGFPTELDNRVLDTSKALKGRFAFTEDLNAGKTTGFSYIQSVVGNGTRSSSSTAYLQPVINRSNLDVLINTHVTKLLAELTPQKSPPVFRTAQIAQTQNGPQFHITATKEIILCGGVVGTPQLLLLSGVGPKSELAKLNITSIIDLPDVGKNLAEHPLLANYFTLNSNATFDDVLRNQTLFGEDLNEWLSNKQGLFVDSPANVFGFMRLPDGSDIIKHQSNPASGPLSANTEILFVDGFAAFGNLQQPATGSFMSILTALVSPTSRGSITLKSSNPFEDPIIDPGLLLTDFDILAMVQAMKDAQSFIETTLWRNFVIGPFGDLANATTNNDKIKFIRDNAVTVNHPVGTARMSPKQATWGVTDSDLLVKGAKGLRIVDASVFPLIPECHPQALVYTVAERAADLIKQQHGIS